MKFTQRDTVFIRRRSLPVNKLLYTIISKEDKVIINGFVNFIHSTVYDFTYIEKHLHDGNEYKFYITKNKSITSIYIYGNKGPKKLHSFATWLFYFEHRYKFHLIEANVNFGNLNRVVLPPLPPAHLPKHDN